MNKEIHFYEYNTSKLTASAWNDALMQIHNGVETIHTNQIGLLSTALFSDGYRIFIHESEKSFYEIRLGCYNTRTNREIKMYHNLFKLWRVGEFELRTADEGDWNADMEALNDFMIQNNFEFVCREDKEHYHYRKVVEGIPLIYLLVAPHSGTKNRFMLRADIEDEHDKWSNCRFQRFYKDIDDFKKNWGKYLIFDEDDEMCN